MATPMSEYDGMSMTLNSQVLAKDRDYTYSIYLKAEYEA